MTTQQHRLRTTIGEFWSQYKVLHERRQLLDRPWLEEVLHWAPEGQLHGHLAPPSSGGPPSITTDGWCPGQRQVPASGPVLP